MFTSYTPFTNRIIKRIKSSTFPFKISQEKYFDSLNIHSTLAVNVHLELKTEYRNSLYIT